MLSFLRDLTKKWWVRIPLGLLVLSFGLWGINDVFTGTHQTTLARVGSRQIDERDFLQQLKLRLRRETGPDGQPMSAEQAHATGLDREVLEDMIADAAVLNEADKMGIAASDAMVRKAVNAIPQLQGLDGKLDQARFAQVLSQIGMSEAQFIDQMRSDIIRGQLLQTASIGAPAAPGLTEALMSYANERRSIEYFVLPVEKAGAIPAPDDATLKAYLDARKDQYTTPELRSITLLAVSPDDLTAGISVTDDEVKAAYDAEKRRFEIPESRQLEQIIYPTKEAAEAARKQMDAGKTFEDLLAAQKLSSDDASLGTVNKGDATVPAEAFDIKEGEATQAVQGPFGWVIIKVVKVTSGSTKSLDDARDQLRKELAHEKALSQLTSISTQLTDATASTDNFDDVAKQLKIPAPRKIDGLDAKGSGADGKPIQNLPDGDAFLTDVFTTDEGQKSFVGETPKHTIYVFIVNKVSPPMLPEMAQLHDRLAAAWTTDEEGKRLDAIAADAAKTANGASTNANDLAKTLSLPVKTSTFLARDAKLDDLSPALLELLFATKQGVWISGTTSGGPARVVARVKEIATQTSGHTAADLQKLQHQLTQTIGEEYAGAYRQAIRDATSVTIDEQMFSTLSQRAQ